MSLPAGFRLGSYDILAPLGAGGMGEVYRARDTKLERQVAVKILPADTADSPLSRARFEREARAVAALSHPNILAIHDYGSVDGVTYAVMELLHGETLRQRLDRGPIPQRRAAEIAREIALGLAAAHEKGIVHRDLTPANLFLTESGSTKILDFGLARHYPAEGAESTQSDHTEPGKVVGTTGYMSPEQVRGSSVDHRADIFSFGSVLYEMLSGRRAFQGETSVETMHAILHDEPQPLSTAERPVSPALERIVWHCLEKRPDDRFQSTRDLAFDLAALSGSASAFTSASTPNVSEPRTARRRWLRIAALVAGAAAIAALAAWAANRRALASHPAAAPTFRRLTFRRGNLLSARFAPDGRTVVYSASWEGRPAELFSVRTDSIESQSLGVDGALVASISSRGELALLRMGDGAPTLARLPIGGGAQRQLLESVTAASWGPDGERLAVIRRDSSDSSVEYPIGRRLYRSRYMAFNVRVSPDGKLVALAESNQNRIPDTIAVLDESGRRRNLAVADFVSGFAWSGRTGELLFIGGDSEQQAVRAVDASGRSRVLLPLLGRSWSLHDVSADGRLLAEQSSTRVELNWRSIREPRERRLSWLDGSTLYGLSNDGRTVLFGEVGDGRRNRTSGVYVRNVDGSPAIRLGDGVAYGLSSDGRWALALSGDPPEIVRLPIGPGIPQKVTVEGIRPVDAFPIPGDRIAVFYLDGGRPAWAIVGSEGGKPIRLETPGLAPNFGAASSPDGSEGAYADGEGRLHVLSLSGGPSREPPGSALGPGELIQQWSADGKALFVTKWEGLSVRIVRRDIATGRTEPWFVTRPDDAAGLTRLSTFLLARDGESYAYSAERVELSDLYVVDGLR